ncbi:exodeoxyribonuclease VII large subunit [Bermanella marisrubri]|uniref:Exodeoxyribonuclease 7 large subunit n=1 Tax=Bermanella marisrubri TaxID=207949 RepID=Q1N0J3_9GAMM|nr:exodeoxyribonuclease VII large subunit [Bermanella marisrubri]EAT11671.1 exodeoxyribonuclease VII, large subunit [Oceanobacter sp. RED65] [Bermanella marisrubri]QIZ83292.1 exodeoxyribonuclease VII large subunit [Bermanella marisrubri]
MKATQTQPITVSQLNRQSKELLETYLHNVVVTGEISNLARPRSGHWYFSLKDERAQVRCAMFKNRTQFVNFAPKEGDQVIIYASVSLYEARGDYQLIVNKMESAGEGALRAAFDALKKHLFTQGLFNQEYKQALPKHPQHLGVITSPTGAAIRDVLSVLKRRMPSLPVSIYPTQVQGQQAAAQIVAAIERANRDQQCDVIILTRGGGSLEDLWPFNEEAVAWAIFHSRIPIISAVGHEVDVSISDFVADVRAATPSAAAEMVSMDRFEWLGRFENAERALLRAWSNRIQHWQFRVEQLSKRIRHPREKLQENMQRLDMASMRLNTIMEKQLQREQTRVAHLVHRFYQVQPQRQLERQKLQLQQLNKRLQLAMKQELNQFKHRLQNQAEVLNAVSPLSTLGRGYAILTTESGEAIRSSKQVTAGDTIHGRLHQGSITATILNSDDAN